MKKTIKNFLISISILTAMTFTSGCHRISDKFPESSFPESSTAESSSNSEQSSEKSADPEPVIDTNGKYVFDDAKAIPDKQLDQINSTAGSVSFRYKINFAAATVAKLGDKSAKDYAESYYKKLYGDSDGILFLINNDTGNDYILRKGAPSKFISDSDVEMLFSRISPMLVTGNYADAVSLTTELAENSLPEFAIDRTGKMKKEEIQDINSILTGNNESFSVIYVNSTEGKSMADYAKEQKEKFFSPLDSGSRAVMIVNTENAEYSICGYGGFADVEKKSDEIKDQINGCLTENDGNASFNCKSAAEIFVNFMGK